MAKWIRTGLSKGASSKLLHHQRVLTRHTYSQRLIQACSPGTDFKEPSLRLRGVALRRCIGGAGTHAGQLEMAEAPFRAPSSTSFSGTPS